MAVKEEMGKTGRGDLTGEGEETVTPEKRTECGD